MTNHLTTELHPCSRCAWPIRAALRWCWRCPPRTFSPLPADDLLGTWRSSGARVGLNDAATTTTTPGPRCSVCGAGLAGTTARSTGRCSRLDHHHRAARPTTTTEETP